MFSPKALIKGIYRFHNFIIIDHDQSCLYIASIANHLPHYSYVARDMHLLIGSK